MILTTSYKSYGNLLHISGNKSKKFDEFLEIMRDSKKSKDGIMQMASGYKDDLEEMYEQYVFQMEEQGLQPMSFSQFLAQARAGMADGGIMEKDMRGGGFIPEGTKDLNKIKDPSKIQ